MSEQTVGWALHALEPDEEFEAVEHMAGCEECRRTASDVADVTTGLATALPQHEPPAGLRESIVEQARRTPQRASGADERPVPGDRLSPPAPAAGRRPAHRAAPSRPEPPAGDSGRPPAGPGHSRRRWTARTGRVLVAAAAVVAVLVGGGVLVGEIQSLRAERDASIAQAQQMEGVLAAIARPGTQHAFLAPPSEERAVAAVIVQDGQREIVPMGLTPNRADDQTYVLWGLDAQGDPTAVGTFDVRSGATGPTSVASAASGAFETYAVSLEQGREAPPEPSGVVAAGQVEI